ncbi:MAG: hypothetical protein RL291_575 [Pseudomonadota bacterium]|jgi:MFS family permease
MRLLATKSVDTTPVAEAARPDSRRVIVATTGPTFALSFLQFLMPVIGAEMMRSLGSPSEAYGLVAAVMAAGCVGLFLANSALMPALGPVAIAQAALALNIIGAALMMIGQWPLVLIGAFVTGFGFAAITPASSQLIADFVPKNRWATAFSLRVTAIPIGGIAAGLLGTSIAAQGGWRAALAMASVILGLSSVFLITMPRYFNAVRPLVPLRLGDIFRRETVLKPFGLLRSSWPLRQIVMAGACLSLMHGVLSGFLVAYLTSKHGLSIEHAGLLFAIVQGMGIVGRFGLGPLADRLGSSVPILIVLAPLGFGSLLLVSLFDPTWPFWLQAAITAFAGLTVSTFTGLYLAEVARRAPREHVGLATTASGIVSFSIYALTPLVFAAIAAIAGWSLAFALLGMAGAFVVFFLAMPKDLAEVADARPAAVETVVQAPVQIPAMAPIVPMRVGRGLHRKAMRLRHSPRLSAAAAELRQRAADEAAMQRLANAEPPSRLLN